MSNVSFYFCPRGLPRTNTITDKLVMYCTALGSEVRQIPIIFNLICIRFLLMDWMAPIDRPRSELNLAINNQPQPSSPRPTSGLDIKMKQNLDLHLTSDMWTHPFMMSTGRPACYLYSLCARWVVALGPLTLGLLGLDTAGLVLPQTTRCVALLNTGRIQ